MAGSTEGSQYLAELKEFLTFLRKLWALLAGVSVLFPLSNALVRVIPLAQWDQGGLAYLSPRLVTVLSTLACLFVVLRTFATRRELGAQLTGRTFQKRATRRFVLGLVAVGIYLAGYYAIAGGLYYDVLGWESDDLRRIVGDFVLLIAYTGFFGFMTSAFMLIGLSEYLGAKTPGPG